MAWLVQDVWPVPPLVMGKVPVVSVMAIASVSVAIQLPAPEPSEAQSWPQVPSELIM